MKQSRFGNQMSTNSPRNMHEAVVRAGVNQRAKNSARIRQVKVSLPKVSIQTSLSETEAEDLGAHDRWNKS